jgi:hypothetical protein
MESRVLKRTRLLTRGHYVYALGYYDGRQGNPYDQHFKDECLKELYMLGFNSGCVDRRERDNNA